MIIDKIENSKLYAGISDRIAKAFAYINDTDLLQLEPGKYEIENDTIFVLIQEYNTKDKSEAKLEAHRKYIDVQYMISGDELMGVTSLTNQQPVVINEENDYSLYDDYSTFIKVSEGMFTIFFPDDLHMPCIKVNQISKIKKAVIKIKI